MPFQRADRALLALAIGFVVLIAAVLSSAWLVQRQQEAQGWVTHTLQVQNQLATVLARVEDAETGQRGFLLTRQPEFLQPYDSAARNLPKDLNILAAAIQDNPRQRASMADLRMLADARYRLLTVNLDRAGAGLPIDTPLLLRGRVMMDQLRAVIARMSAEEARLLRARTRNAALQGDLLVGLLLASAFAGLGLGVFVFSESRRQIAAVTRVSEALGLSNRKLKAEAESREAAEAAVRQMQKMEAIGQLTGGIAHDFNNMLAIVLGSLDLARRRLRTAPDKAEACIDNAIVGAERAAQLTSRLLAFSRQQPLAPNVLDINRLVGGMSEMLRRTLGEEVEIETVLAGGLWRAYADPGQLENAILNLCVNARDAMGGHGNLTIETTNAHLDDAYAATHAEVEPGQYVMASVTDTGSGMTEEAKTRAFDPFFTTKAVGKGTGLGLSQVHGFIKQSGGHVKIYSEADIGTTVKLYLPRSLNAEEAASEEASVMVDLPAAKAGEIVYVVEDEEQVRTFTVDVLRELGYTVVHAGDGAKALANMPSLPRIDLLFTDIIMPGMNGRQLYDQALEVRPDLKVLYTTGYTRNAIVHNGVLDANVAFLAKPFSVAQLATKVRQVLDAGGANRT